MHTFTFAEPKSALHTKFNENARKRKSPKG